MSWPKGQLVFVHWILENQYLYFVLIFIYANETIQIGAVLLDEEFKRCRTDFADIQNKKECGGNIQWQNHYLRNWAEDTKDKRII